MNQPYFMVREEPIPRLEGIVRDLVETSRQADPGKVITIRLALRVALTAECLQCHTRATGDELLSLSSSFSKPVQGRLKRLQQGMCAREGCTGTIYRLVLNNHSDINWARFFLPAEEPAAKRYPAIIDTIAQESQVRRKARRQTILLRIGVAIGIAILLILLHHWYWSGKFH